MLRLSAVERSIARRSRVRRWLRRLLLRPEPQDVMKILRYRPDLYGAHLNALKEAAFRASSYWSPEEQDLFAAFVSRLRQCEICTVMHALPASRHTGRNAVAAVLADWRSASLRPPVAAAFRALETLVQDTPRFGSADLEELRALGVPPGAIKDLLYISTVMSINVRVASALGATLDGTFARAVRQFRSPRKTTDG